MRHFDVVILGAGSAGEIAAAKLSEAGRSVAVVEKLRVGGTCAYLSCMPSKAMIRSASVRSLIRQAEELGAASYPIDLSDGAQSFVIAAQRRDQISDFRDDGEAAKSLTSSGVQLFRGEGVFVDNRTLKVDTDSLTWNDLILATGSSPTVPEIEGLDSVSFWTSDDALTTSECPKSMIIVGGGPVGCELAQIFTRFGSKVTIIEFGPQLAGREHPEVASRLQAVLESENVDVFLKSQVLNVSPSNSGEIKAELSSGETLFSARLVICSGRHPNSKSLNLELLSIELNEKGAVQVDENCRVKGLSNVWAAGDITGIAPFTHTANYQATIVADNILGASRVANYTAIPRAIYSDPPVFSVGFVALEDDENLVSARSELSDNSRNETDGTSGGVVVLTANRCTGELVGGAAIGPHADHWMSEIALALCARIKLSTLVDVVHAFPTYSQSLDQPIFDLAKICGETEEAHIE